MSSIYDALQRLQDGGAEAQTMIYASRPQVSRGRSLGVIVAAVAISSLITGIVIYFMLVPSEVPAAVEPRAVEQVVQPEVLPDPMLLMRNAEQKKRAGDVAGAIDDYQKLQVMLPNRKDIYISLGALYYGSAEYDKALVTYNKALNYFKDDAGLLNNIGGVLLAKNDNRASIEYFERSHRFSGNYVEPVYNLACAYAKLGETDKAVAKIQEAYQMHPDVKIWAKSDPDLEVIRGVINFDAVDEKE